MMEEDRREQCSSIEYQALLCKNCFRVIFTNIFRRHHTPAQAKMPSTYSGGICRSRFSGGRIFFFIVRLMTFFWVFSSCDSIPTTGCPGPDYIIQENGHCCGVTSCNINFTVLICQENYGSDICVPCPADSFLLDKTTSETATKCIKPNCLEKTRPSLVKSTDIDPLACPEWCECDLSSNFCGTDPCNCRKVTCPYGRILQQNCGCSPVTPSPPKPIPPKDTPVTVANFTTTMPRTNGSVTSASQVDTSTPRDNRSTTKSTAITTMEPDSHSSETTIIMVVTMTILFIIIGIVVCYLCRRYIWKQKTPPDSQAVPTRPDTRQENHTHNNFNIHIGNAEKVHVGDKGVIHVAGLGVEEADDGVTDGVEQPLLSQPPVREPNGITEVVIEHPPSSSVEELHVDSPKSIDGIDEETELKSVISGPGGDATGDRFNEETELKSVISGPGGDATGDRFNEETIVKSVIGNDDEETKVKSVNGAAHEEIELQSIPKKCGQAPLVKGEDTRIGLYTENDKKTNGNNVVPDCSQQKIQQNGVVDNGHKKSSIQTQFKGFR